MLKKYSVLKNDVTISIGSDNTIQADITLPVELLTNLQATQLTDTCPDKPVADPIPSKGDALVLDWFIEHGPHADEPIEQITSNSESESVDTDSAGVDTRLPYSVYPLIEVPAETELAESESQVTVESNVESEKSDLLGDRLSLAAQEARYLTITDDIIKDHLVSGGTILALCDKFELVAPKYTGRLFKRGSRLRSEDASIPRHGRRVEKDPDIPTY